MLVSCIFFFKQKTAYEIVDCDWSSDVCSSDLIKDIYVGHTTNFKLRNCGHKKCCNNPNNKNYNEYKYQFIRENGGYENFYMIKIKDFPCTEKRAAEAEENRIMIELGATLNTNKPYLTQEDKTRYQKEYDKKYDENNKDKRSKDHSVRKKCKSRC